MSDAEIPTEGLAGTKTPEEIKALAQKMKGKTLKQRVKEFKVEMEEQMSQSDQVMINRRLSRVTQGVEEKKVEE